MKNYWKNQIKLLKWYKKPRNIIIKKNGRHIWYSDGETNVFYNCIECHLINKKIKNKNAIITLDKNGDIKKYTYLDINSKVNAFCTFLKSQLGLKFQKKRVMIHSSASIDSAISMLACSKLGIHFSVIFEDLEILAIKNRISIFKPNLLISRANKANFNKKFQQLQKIKDIKIFFFKEITLNNIACVKHPTSKVKSDKSLFTLFTSGSTGQPKGITHTTGGYLLYAKLTCKKQFGLNKQSTILTASDAGWINGHTYALFGPLSFGSTTVLLESPMLLLNEKILKKILKLDISILYVPVTIIRLMKSLYKNKFFKSSSLKTLGSMGEPLAPSVGMWFAKFFKKSNKAIINTYFQTETGGIVCSPTYKESAAQSPHGSVGKPVTKFLNINTLDLNKKEILITKPWPGCLKKVLNGKKYFDKYFDKNKSFRLFDLATIFKKNVYVHGRMDDVINVRGHRIGSAEIESVVIKNKFIKECSVVTINDELEGSAIILFVASQYKEKQEQIKKGIQDEIFSTFGSFAIPKRIVFISSLPKTRSGKILRRLLRDICADPTKPYDKDISTIMDIDIIEEVRKKIQSNI